MYKNLAFLCLCLSFVLTSASVEASFVKDFESDPVGSAPAGFWIASFDPNTYVTDSIVKTGSKALRASGYTTISVTDNDTSAPRTGIFAFDVYLQSWTAAKIQVLISDGAGYRVNVEMASTYIRDNSAGSTFLDGTMTLNQWSHVVFKLDMNAGANGEFELFIDGVSKGVHSMAAGTGTKLESFFFAATGYGTHYYDNVRFFQPPANCAGIFENKLGIAGDLNEDCYVNMKDVKVFAQDWLECSDPEKERCWPALGLPAPTYNKAFPGYYVVSLKAFTPIERRFAKLGMYEFQSNGTVATKSWTWYLDGGDNSGGYLLSDRIIGTGNGQPANNSDTNKYIKGLSQHLGAESNLKPLNGTWVQNGRKLDVTFSDGSWEKWYVTWEEPNNLYKIELYDASYVKPGTGCWLTTDFAEEKRNSTAKSGGFGFGCASRDFNYAAPVAQLWKEHIGCAISYGLSGTATDDISPETVAGMKSAFAWTSNNVLRYTYWGNGYQVFAYYSMPISNPGILARRTIYQTSHDFSNNGNIEDEVGHIIPGLQIVDANGNYRGTVGVQWASSTWVQAMFWLDTAGTSASGPSRTGVAGKTIGEVYINEQFENVAPGQRPGYSGWYFGGTGSGYVSDEYAHSGTQSLKLGNNSISRSILSSDYLDLSKGSVSFWVYMIPDEQNTNNLQYLQWIINGTYTGLGINLVMSPNYIKDYSTDPATFFDSSLSMNAWHHVVIDFNHFEPTAAPRQGTYTLYVDGVKLGKKLMDTWPGDKTHSYSFAVDNIAVEHVKYIDELKITDGTAQNCLEAKMRGIVLDGDVNLDCYSDLKDIAVLAQSWLKCNNPSEPSCAANW